MLLDGVFTVFLRLRAARASSLASAARKKSCISCRAYACGNLYIRYFILDWMGPFVDIGDLLKILTPGLRFPANQGSLWRIN